MPTKVITEQAEGIRNSSVLSSFEKEKTGTAEAGSGGVWNTNPANSIPLFSFTADLRNNLREEDNGQTGYL